MNTTDAPPTAAAAPITAMAATPPEWLARGATVASETLQAVGRRLVPAPASLMAMTVGYQVMSRAISAAAELGLADHLATGPRSLAELAAAAGAERGALDRLLRALELAGIVRTRRDGRVELTRLGAPLRGDHPQSLRDWCRYLGADWHWELWSGLDTSVRDGQTAYAHRFQTDFFGWFEARPDEAATFDAAMRSFSSLVDRPVAAACPLADTQTILDIAGGSGALLAELLRANPHLDGTLFDRGDVVARAAAAGPLLEEGLRSRVSFVAGDMFDEIPDGHDVYVMKWILHDWADERAAAILARLAQAMRPGARLLLVEMLIERGRANGPARQLDLAMLVLTGGRERTADEFRSLLDAAGFDLRAIRRTASPMFVLDATRR